MSDPAVKIESAGTAALIGAPADASSIVVAQRHGLDLSAHRARQLTPEILHQADLILALDHSHQAWISNYYPQLRGRTFKLGHWSNGFDVADPYRKPFEAFETAYDDIDRCVEAWLKKLA